MQSFTDNFAFFTFFFYFYFFFCVCVRVRAWTVGADRACPVPTGVESYSLALAPAPEKNGSSLVGEGSKYYGYYDKFTV